MKAGLRFSTNAPMPSFWSSVAKIAWNIRRSNRRPSARGTSKARFTASLVIIASGRVVYDLEAWRTKHEENSTAIIRLEQYYPLPAAELAKELSRYPDADVVWVQDEPRNQGGWPFLALNLPSGLAQHGETRALRVVSRPESAAPSTGSSKQHAAQQEELLTAAFAR